MVKQPTRKTLDKRLLINVLLLCLTFLVLLNLFMVNKIKYSLTPEQPPKLDVILIADSACKECTPVETIRDELYLERFDIESEQIVEWTQSPDLITDFEISKIPAIIIKTNIDKIQMPFPVVNGAYIVETDPPYTDPHTQKTKGLVHATIIKAPNCEECNAAQNLLEDIRNIAVIKEVNEMTWNDDLAKQMIYQYELSRLPTILLSQELEKYPLITNHWERVGIQTEGGNFLMTKTPPPYLDLKSNQVKGLVTVTIIEDATCSVCYDPQKHIDNLKAIGVSIKEAVTIQSNSQKGMELIKKYNIKKLPTILIDQEVSEYQVFQEVWGQVGTVEADGMFVFRNQEKLPQAVYHNLELGELRQGTG